MASASDSQFFNPSQMMAQAEQYAVGKASKSTRMILGLGALAGLFVGLGFVFYISVTTGSTAGWGMTRLIGGLAFSMGLMLVIVCGGELFTSSVLSIIARANRQISTGKMLRVWGKVYLGNLIGALVLVALITGGQLYNLNDGQWGLNAMHIAQHKLHHTPVQALCLGILCNLLVCLAIWMTFCTSNIAYKLMMIVLPVAMFVCAGFEHCVANMFMVPIAIAIKATASPEFWTSIGATPAEFADLNLAKFVLANLIPVTIGNIIGGTVLVGLNFWSIYRLPVEKNLAVSVQNSSQQPQSPA
ncbi:formate transporter FocA [Paraferrimonas sedimenticola]|uniref:Formate transporter FocA n=1 Tax=Paraferrimonas sedimenticola TaxID=375674 RepID=A0AA37RUE5_9GAMM|nr:formate transporter FocA [Paraferrimonas sedimenticola]GLP95359.1 hypothetical protein GCM10007895_06650 [Paraferrimonas sedimenticola]